MPASWIIPSHHDLDGTVFMELLPGPYAGHCWNDSSIYFTEEHFGFFEPLLEQSDVSYDHFSFNEIDAQTWMSFIASVRSWVAQIDAGAGLDDLSPSPGYLFLDTRDSFKENEAATLQVLALTGAELTQWLEKRLESHDVVSVLGI